MEAIQEKSTIAEVLAVIPETHQRLAMRFDDDDEDVRETLNEVYKTLDAMEEGSLVTWQRAQTILAREAGLAASHQASSSRP